MKSLQYMEVIGPYILALLLFITIKLLLPVYYYWIMAFLFGLYFFPVSLFFVKANEKRSLRWRYSAVFLSILLFSSLNLAFNEVEWIKISLGIFGIVCYSMLIHIHFSGKLSVRLFLLLFGFGNLSGLDLFV